MRPTAWLFLDWCASSETYPEKFWRKNWFTHPLFWLTFPDLPRSEVPVLAKQPLTALQTFFFLRANPNVMTAFCNQAFVSTLYLPKVCFPFNTTAGMPKNWFCVHLQRQQSRLVLTCVSYCKGYTLTCLFSAFISQEQQFYEGNKKKIIMLEMMRV